MRSVAQAAWVALVAGALSAAGCGARSELDTRGVTRLPDGGLVLPLQDPRAWVGQYLGDRAQELLEATPSGGFIPVDLTYFPNTVRMTSDGRLEIEETCHWDDSEGPAFLHARITGAGTAMFEPGIRCVATTPLSTLSGFIEQGSLQFDGGTLSYSYVEHITGQVTGEPREARVRVSYSGVRQ